MTNKDISSIVLEDGTKLVDTVKIKREKNGVLSAVITKDQMRDIKDSYSKEIPSTKWVEKKEGVGKTVKGEMKRLYELPQIIFKTNKLDRVLYDPIRLAERKARAEK